MRGKRRTGESDKAGEPSDLQLQLLALRRRLEEASVDARRSATPAAAEAAAGALETMSGAIDYLVLATGQVSKRTLEVVSARRDAEAERQRYQELFEFAPYAYVVTDVWGVIRQANRAAGEMFQHRGLIRRPLMARFAPPERRIHATLVQRFRIEGGTWTGELVLSRPQVARTVRATATPARDITGQLAGLHWILQDVTDEKAARIEIEELNTTLEHRVAERTAALADLNRRLDDLLAREQVARADAEAANRAKDAFIAMLSHELRTPLTPALVMASALERDAELPHPVREALAVVRRNIELEARLIDDLLDLTRVTRGKLQVRLEPLSLHGVAVEVLSAFRSQFEAKRLAVEVDLAAPADRVFGDAGRLLQVFSNIIGNAVKFTPPGGAIVIRSRNDERGAVAVEVRDSGVGIGTDDLPRIFRPFSQAPDGRTSGGLGLGLSISRALVAAHGGTLAGDSEGSGKGSVFTVTLPVHATVPGNRAARPVVPAQDCPPGLVVLLVEDNRDTLRSLSMLLERIGCDVRAAASLAEARAAADPIPDVVISDLGLPDGSGLSLMRELAARGPVKGIALSGYGSEADLRRSREAGFTRHLTKPVSFVDVRRVLAEVVAEAPADR